MVDFVNSHNLHLLSLFTIHQCVKNAVFPLKQNNAKSNQPKSIEQDRQCTFRFIEFPRQQQQQQ
jgi:hypothetical protein